MTEPLDQLLSIVVPVYNEEENILRLLDGLRSSVECEHETLLVFDFDEDTTLPPARIAAEVDQTIRLVRNQYGRGVLNALKSGIDAAAGDVVCVVMADLSDDLTQIDTITRLVRNGATVVSPSRYMRGGRQVGGPPLKRTLSRVAGLSLRWLTRIGTHDPTNNFKAYAGSFLDSVEIESVSGFELALELTTKAHAAGEQIVEIPTTWTDRTSGASNFKLIQWIPSYATWYFRAIKTSWFR